MDSRTKTGIFLLGIGFGLSALVLNRYKRKRSSKSTEEHQDGLLSSILGRKKKGVCEAKENIFQVKEYITRVKTVYFGCGAMCRIDTVIEYLRNKLGVKKVLLLVSRNGNSNSMDEDHSVDSNHPAEVIKARLEEYNVVYIEKVEESSCWGHDKDVNDATSMGKRFNAQVVMSVGCRRVCSVGKIVSCLLHPRNYRRRCNFFADHPFDQSSSIPHVSIPTTFDNHRAFDHFAMLRILPPGRISPSSKQRPQGVRRDIDDDTAAQTQIHFLANTNTYPLFSICDPMFTKRATRAEILHSAMLTLGIAIDAATSVHSQGYSGSLCTEAVELIAAHLPNAMNSLHLVDDRTRYWLSYASFVAAKASNLAFCHLCYVLALPLLADSSVHPGQVVACLVPAIIRHIYPQEQETLKRILAPITKNRGCWSADKMAKRVEMWIKAFGKGANEKLNELFPGIDLDNLVRILHTPSLYLLVKQTTVFVGKKDEEIDEVLKLIYLESIVD